MDGDEAGRRTADGCHQCPPLQSTVMCCTVLDGTGLDWIGRVCHCLVRYSTVRRYKGRDWKPVGALGDCEVALALRTTSCTSLPACQPATYHLPVLPIPAASNPSSPSSQQRCGARRVQKNRVVFLANYRHGSFWGRLLSVTRYEVDEQRPRRLFSCSKQWLPVEALRLVNGRKCCEYMSWDGEERSNGI